MPVNHPGQEPVVALSRSSGRGGRVRLAAPAWAAVGLVCLALAGVLVAVVVAKTSWVQPADEQWLRWMLDIRSAPGISVAKVLNVVAGGTVMWIVRLVTAAGLALWRRWRALTIFAAAELCAELCIGPVKALVNRPRPPGPLVAVTGQSMPSGHAVTAAATAVALALILTRPGRSRLLALATAGAWSILVALSRTYLSAHWLTDVLVGLLIGAGWATSWFGALGTSQRTLRPQAAVPAPGDPGTPAQ
jgi:membrane-associated phospholipid phosphatase